MFSFMKTTSVACATTRQYHAEHSNGIGDAAVATVL